MLWWLLLFHHTQTFKKLNLVQTGMRELVIDLRQRKLYNIDTESKATEENGKRGKQKKVAREELKPDVLQDHDLRKVLDLTASIVCAGNHAALTKTATVLKVFQFQSISSVQDVPGVLNKIKIHFIGGQRPYDIEFMTTKQKTTFCRVHL